MHTPAIAALPLPLAPVGKPVRVIEFRAGKNMEHRLASMGVTVGSIINPLEQGHGGIIVAIGNTRLALGYGIAHKIMVTPED